MIVGADLGDKHIAALEDSIREMLRRYAYTGIAHRRCCHIVNVGLAAQPQVSSLHDSGQFVFGDAWTSLAFKRLNRQVAKLSSSPQELDLLLALDQPELHQLRREVYKFSLREHFPHQGVLFEWNWTYHANATVSKSSRQQVFSSSNSDIGSSPAHICNTGDLAGIGDE